MSSNETCLGLKERIRARIAKQKKKKTIMKTKTTKKKKKTQTKLMRSCINQARVHCSMLRVAKNFQFKKNEKF